MPVLLPFAKSSDVEVLAGCDHDRAQLAVEIASGGIRNALGWDVDHVTDATFTKLYRNPYAGPLGGLDPQLSTGEISMSRPAPTIVLPCLNLTAVSEVEVDGVVLTEAEWDADYRAGLVFVQAAPYRVVTITYSGGYLRQPEDTAPGALRQVCIEQAIHMVSNPQGLKAYTLVGASETFSELIPLVDDDRLAPLTVSLL